MWIHVCTEVTLMFMMQLIVETSGQRTYEEGLSQDSVPLGDADVVEVVDSNAVLNGDVCHVEQVAVLDVQV